MVKKKVSKIGEKRRTVKKRVFKKNVEKVNTGIPGLDRLIEGGFEKKSSNVIVGGSGSGKTIFAVQFLVEGMKRGEKCLYVTFEEKKEQFYRHIKEFGWDLQDYEEKGLFTFLEYTPIKVKKMLDEGGGAIESTILREKISRIAIDSITSFILLFDKELERREAALMLFGMISDWDCTSLLTLEEDPLKSSVFTSKAVEFESDSITLMYYLQHKGERTRYLEILKMRGVDHSRKVHEFKIDKNGLYITKKTINEIQ
ncbi:MAG: RAD55 family ATPase [Candidatus Pacearchaeota archaeon]